MEKSADAFRTISEVSELLQTPAHVLRFWESRFAQVKPVKRAGGRRYYRPSDLALLGGIKRLLHDEGMTIRGVQKVLREQGVRHVAALSPVEAGQLSDQTDEGGGFAAPVPERKPARPAATVTPLWPVSPTPEAAPEGDRLQPDPDDLAASIAEEAPMMVDVEPLPEPAVATLHRFRTESAPEPETDLPPPAAAMLRAMDALRARDHQEELASIHGRLQGLRDRLARSRDPGRD
ncbi:MAG: MerR family transcriptional regulator [Proteobacteria bacterium]|nr:MerR family transcriptional regulator [Pseudomonadota bacterium]